MFNIKYETWKNICEMYFRIPNMSKESYLQWFPFSKLSAKDRNEIVSQEFFDKYIKLGGVVFFEEVMMVSENYIQKSDASFRDSSLVSPILYLLLQCIGKEICDKYLSKRNENISYYYAGDYKKLIPQYKISYDMFFKEINFNESGYNYFIKTDVANFFNNINVNKLIKRIDRICNESACVFSQTQLMIYKEFLLYCGKGRFPLIENSMCSSYLATVVYLDEIDERLYNYIKEKSQPISSFKMIRYVDDLYILFNSKCEEAIIKKEYNSILEEYSSILKEYNLTINSSKCCVGEIKKIKEELKKSIYDEIVNGVKFEITDYYSCKLENFIEKLAKYDYVDIKSYNEEIKKCFNEADIEYTSNEVFTHIVYSNSELTNTDKLVVSLEKMIKEKLSTISLDSRRLTSLIMKTRSESVIKTLLSQLFSRFRNGLWNSYDTSIATSYLIKRKFQHKDLLKVLKHHCESLYDYYCFSCKRSFLKSFKDEQINQLIDIIGEDWKSFYLYFMYIVENEKGNYLFAYASFKSFFDRISATLAYVSGYDCEAKEPNYRRFYKDGELKNFYKDVRENETIIANAQDLRNKNPFIHSSAECLNSDETVGKIEQSIKDLNYLINEYQCINIK